MFERVPVQRVASPCVNICRLDRKTGWCIGCGRTGDEIARWTSVDDHERAAMLASLPARMAEMTPRRR